MIDLARLRQIAEYQQESGCRVEYPASTVLGLLDELEAERKRTKEQYASALDRALENRQ